ncbi:non-hydrolyzing UDP-N-acetylglucosamine 2-epimerase [Exiguobacterium undae]|uniref:UDP-N-acetylglucosamine 2-epimerase (non-hydrolyzing) n=1 Tax=Exiguobacterium undae TaxID=169177 RepID=A0ABX2V522_9BACL|nr:UDP-N-acetylglucosamine 2-epimerase (non-hydrolyzing) [Exiguobacterium undae]OAN10189.1 UDP-N-acetyl glucosamine 2-epimerase [Exiguobacterium undae]
MPIKVMPIFGTRPEAIKMAPLVNVLKQNPAFDVHVTITAQHREMLDQVLELFEITPDHDLNIMKPRQTLVDITTRGLEGLDAVMKEVQPDLVLVHGDTTTTFVGSLAAYYNQIAVGHVEAGLRTYDKYSPFPEEVNRQLTSTLADLHFAPTDQAAANLASENRLTGVYVTGNTAIDALQTTVQPDYVHPVLETVGERKLVLMTAHRRENQGAKMHQMFRAIRRLADDYPDIHIVYPVHLNPVVQEAAKDVFKGHDRITLIPPLDVFDFHNFASRAHLILTDSGGVQEEAPSLGVPVLVLRDTTERPEGVKAGTLKLAGTDEDTIYRLASELLDDKVAYAEMAHASNPYGDGHASERIAAAILEHFNQEATFEPFHVKN